jgi:hypothetical protein
MRSQTMVFVRMRKAATDRQATGRSGWPKCYHRDENCRVIRVAISRTLPDSPAMPETKSLGLEEAEAYGWKPCQWCAK